MGKGGGCIFSKRRSILEASDPDPPNPGTDDAPLHPPNQTPTTVGNSSYQEAKKVFIVFYSMYGHVECLAKRIKKGVDSIDGVEGYLYRVRETLPTDVLEQMRVPQKEDELPFVSVNELVEADGLLFGFPTRFGSMASQMKAFFDSTGSLWEKQRLAGVPAGLFVSTGTQGGGQETTALTAITQLAHHGMVYVPIGYTFGADMFKLDSIRGGSPYGSGVYSGDGTRVPSQTELALAEHQGKYFAALVKRFASTN